MKDIKKDPFEEYIRQTEPSKYELGYAWYTAIGLQAVDGLETSEYLKKTAKENIEGKITLDEAGKLIESYYEESGEKNEEDTKEADIVSTRIANILAENAWYFRNSLVRANYNDYTKGIRETTEYLELFLRNLLLGESNELKNRYIHVLWQKQDIGSSKPDIEERKQDIGDSKPDIEKLKQRIQRYEQFSLKTKQHILDVFCRFEYDKFFGRVEIMKVLSLSAASSSELIKKMLGAKLIYPIKGKGKGKYLFRRE